MSQPDDSDTYSPRQLYVAGCLVWCGASFAVLSILAAALAGFGHQWGWWRFQTGFLVLQGATYGALGAAAIGLVAFLSAVLMRRGRLMLCAAAIMVASLGTVAVPLSHVQSAGSMPPIHDITTDTEDPPAFVALAPARERAMNGVAYPGPDAARMQERAYPWVEPLRVDVPRRAAFDAALAEARAEGWTVAAVEPQQGRIEATAETFWFGFKDDIVIRVQETEDGRVRIDMRSASRVGISDLGVNADRIARFLDALQQRLAG